MLRAIALTGTSRSPYARIAACLAVAGLGLLAEAARAADRFWVSDNGLWNQSINWSPAGVPGPTDSAIVNSFFSLSRINTTAIGSVASVSIFNSASVSISNQGSLLCAGDFVVGQYNGPGASSIGSLHVLTNNPNIAFPGGMTINGNLRLAQGGGKGAVTQDAGTINVGNAVSVASTPSAGFGSYTLTGTGFLRAKSVNVGANSLGDFRLSGFANVNVENLTLGSSSSSAGVGTISQTGGRMIVSSYFHMSQPHGLPSVATAYNLSGGTFSSPSTHISGGVFNYTGGAASLGNLYFFGSGSIHISGGGNKVLHANSLFFNDYYAKIDLSDNSMLLTDTPPDLLFYDVRRGYNGGAWTGDGITSSFAYATALLNLPHKTAVGYGPVPEGTLVKYTYVGDANVDGIVNLQDFNRLAANFGRTDAYWFEGDFNYDLAVNLQDFNLLASNFGLSAAGTTVTPEDWANLASAVPEPSGGLLVACGSTAILARRRRRGM